MTINLNDLTPAQKLDLFNSLKGSDDVKTAIEAKRKEQDALKLEVTKVIGEFSNFVSESINKARADIAEYVNNRELAKYELSWRVNPSGEIDTKSGLISGSRGDRNTSQVSAPALLKRKGFLQGETVDGITEWTTPDGQEVLVGRGEGTNFKSAAEFARDAGYDIP